jgi:hypothetical protein
MTKVTGIPPQGVRRTPRRVVFEEPADTGADLYRKLYTVDGYLVGWLCRECGRLYERPHLPGCSRASKAIT